MGRKKKRAALDARDRIFCYYCDRTFQQEQELLAHQKEKHLRCPHCNRRMLSVRSLAIHAEQMHNVRLTTVPNSISGRESVTVDVLGMNGIPDSYYASIDDLHLPKRLRDNHLSPVALPHTNPPSAYAQNRSHYITSSALAAAPYTSAHAFSYGAQPPARTASHAYPPGVSYDYSTPPPPAARSASNFAYGYNAPHYNYNAPPPAYSSASVAPVYAPPSTGAPNATSYAQPASFAYTPPPTLPPIRTAFPHATQPDYVQSQPPISSALNAPYTAAEATRPPTLHYNHCAPPNGVSVAPQYTQHQAPPNGVSVAPQYTQHHAPQHLHPPQPPLQPNVEQAAPNTNSPPPPPPQGTLIFKLCHCSPEEERAKLPRYVTKPRCATTS